MDDKFDFEFYVRHIAKLAHELNRAYCMGIGDDSQVSWEDAPEWQKESIIMGVEMHLKNPDTTPAESHQGWLKEKERDGWKYGPVKDVGKKEHPCFVPYEQLPQDQRVKDYMFKACIEQGKSLIYAVYYGEPESI